MDREIPQKEKTKSNITGIIKYVLIAAVIIAALFFFRKFIKKSGTYDDFHIAQVERGDIQNTLTATGTVTPSFEREINAPVNTEIKKVILPKGKLVNSGDLIMELDQEFTQLEYDKLSDELELRRNDIDKLKLTYDKDLKDLEYQDQIKNLQLSQLEADVADKQRLLKIGGATKEDVERAQLQLEVAEIEKKILENNLEYSTKTNVNDKKNLELEFKIQEKRLAELRRKLKETSVRAPINGVITWINEDIGRTVSEGEPLVRIADLSSYIIEATSSDRNAERINVGMPVNVRINNNNLKGEIVTILPAVENNTVGFIVELENSNADFLRPNMRAEVFLITDEKKDVLKIKNGAAFRGASNIDIFVIRGGKAEKTRITRGLSNSDFIEIASGNVKEGDRLIISETTDYDHLDEFEIKK